MAIVRTLPTATARLDKLEKTRERIVLAARDIVAEEGWQGAQVALIAARAQVATGSVYRYFESKGALYTQVLDVVSLREMEILRSIVDSPGPAAQRLERAIEVFVRRAIKNGRMTYALLAEPCEPEIDAARVKYREAFATQVARVVRAGIASGEFADVDESLAASCIAGAFMQAIVSPQAQSIKPDSKAAERIAASIARLCVRMVSKAGGAAPAKPGKSR